MNNTTAQTNRSDAEIHIRQNGKIDIKTAIDHALLNQSLSVDSQADHMATLGAHALRTGLNDDHLRQMEDFGKGIGEPFLSITGLPQLEALPDTPQGFIDDSLVQLPDCLLLGTLQLAGFMPIAFEYENEGRLMRNVAPVATAADSVTSHGAKKPLKFHTDNAYEFEGYPTRTSPSPRVLGFVGLRNSDAHGSPVSTELLKVEDILHAASSALIQALQKRQFQILPGQSNDRSSIGPTPLLQIDQCSGNWLLRFNDNPGQTLGLTRRSSLAIVELSELILSLEDKVTRINVMPGSILLFDNYRTLHRRTSFDPGHDLTQARWLRRCFGCWNRLSGKFADPLSQPFVWR